MICLFILLLLYLKAVSFLRLSAGSVSSFFLALPLLVSPLAARRDIARRARAPPPPAAALAAAAAGGSTLRPRPAVFASLAAADDGHAENVPPKWVPRTVGGR